MSDVTADRVRLTDDIVSVNDYFYDQGLSDGLPIVPPTPERVLAMLQFCDRDADEVLGSMPPGYTEASVQRLAVNAVMAGCQPEFFPVVLTAVEAMLAEEFNLLGVQATTHSVSPLVIVNGPIARELTINGGAGLFGPGWRANATIGRAIRLILLNIGGAYPGSTDKSTFGSPAKYSYCIAENEAETPWGPWHVDNGFAPEDSTVTVLGCESPHNINDHGARSAEELMVTVASTVATAGCNDIYLTGNPIIMFSPEHAATVANDGWDKARVRQYLYDNARVPMSEFNVSNIKRFGPIRPKFFANPDQHDSVPLVDEPSGFTILVAGGPGKHSSFIPTFGETTRVIRPITTKDGRLIRSVTELR